MSARYGRATRLASAFLAPLLLGLGACIDFVDPAVLELEQPARISVQLTLTNRPADALACGGPAVPDTVAADGLGYAALCARATLVPGRTVLGELRPIADSALVLLGVPIAPTPGPDSTLVYLGGALLPAGALDDAPITLRLPELRGALVFPPAVAWVAVGDAQPEPIVHRPGEPLRVDVQLPTATSVPQPSQQFWDFAVVGDTAALSVRSSLGLPPPALVVPATLLAELGSRPRLATLLFTQRLNARSADVLVDIALSERLAWEVAAPAAPD